MIGAARTQYPVCPRRSSYARERCVLCSRRPLSCSRYRPASSPSSLQFLLLAKGSLAFDQRSVFGISTLRDNDQKE